jgi:hypothetical protein
LPKEWRGGASFSAGDASAADPCGPVTADYVTYGPCVQRTLPDGRVVQLRRAHSTDPRSVFGALRVAFTQPDGTDVIAEISAGDKATAAAKAVQRGRARVDAFEAKLIADVTDKRIQRIPETGPGH